MIKGLFRVAPDGGLQQALHLAPEGHHNMTAALQHINVVDLTRTLAAPSAL
jgi:hypothetical protein